MTSIQYPACCEFLPHEAGSPHPFIGATAACWRRYGEVLTREYPDIDRWDMHGLTVDAYAAQHPGVDEHRSAQSVALHLSGLYLVLECGVSAGYSGRAKTVIKSRFGGKFEWLEPPASLGKLTVLDLHATRGAEAHSKIASAWARSVWDVWHLHHRHIKQLVHAALNDLPHRT